MKEIDGYSKNITNGYIEQLKEIFKEAVTEDKLDIDKMLEMIGEEDVEDRQEKYEFTWSGKRESLKVAQYRTTGTLRPCVEDSVNFDTSENIYIEGDNLEVLKILQNSYHRQVKMIYIDPPYNTGNDFVYKDNFGDSIENYKEITEQMLSSNPKTAGRYHSNWLNMMYPRLRVAKALLRDDGVIFISIDDNEVANLRKICDEIFGEDNFVECITWNKRIPKNDKGIGNIHEYILIYVKSTRFNHEFMMPKDGLYEISELLINLKNKKYSIKEAETELKIFYNKKGYDRGITLYNSLDENYEPWGKINLSWPNGDTFGPRYEIIHPITNKPVKIPDRGWRWKKETFDNNLGSDNLIILHDGSCVKGSIWFAKDENTQPSSIKYLKEVEKMLLRSILSTKSDGGMEIERLFTTKSYFSYPKPVSLVALLINSICNDNDIILDFFSGSATTAQAVMQLNAEDNGNRKFICVQLPEILEEKSEAYKAGYRTICDIGKERIRRAGTKILEDYTEKQRQTKLEDLENATEQRQLDIGFKVFKLDSSNLKKWDDTPIKPQDLENLYKRLESAVNIIKEDRSKEDVVYEVLLKIGLPLTSYIEKINILDRDVFSIDDGFILICIDKDITKKHAVEMAELTPGSIIFARDSFRDDTEFVNVELYLNDCNIDIKVV